MDAPEGHDAFSHVVARGSEKAYIKPSSTVKVAMQVTSKQAGGLEAAMRLCRRLYLELEKGKSKEEVEQLKQQWLNLRPKAPKAPKLKAKVRPAEGAHRRKRPSAKEEAKEAKEGKEAEPAPRQKKRRVQPGQPVQRREQPEPALDVKEEPDEAEPRPMARAVFQRPCEGPETLVARVLKDQGVAVSKAFLKIVTTTVATPFSAGLRRDELGQRRLQHPNILQEQSRLTTGLPHPAGAAKGVRVRDRLWIAVQSILQEWHAPD